MQVNFKYTVFFLLIFWSCSKGRANTELENKINLDVQKKVENLALNKELCDFVITTAQKIKTSNNKNTKNNKIICQLVRN